MSTTVQVSLGPTYEPTMWDLRKCVAAARNAKETLVFITITAPIISEVIEVAIESGSLYLVGVRASDGTWWEFAPDTDQSSPGKAREPRPRLANSRWIMVGSLKALSSYRALRLGWFISERPGATGQIVYADSPNKLLRFFRQWNGQLTNYDARLSVCVLIFIICEALRFRSIENICARWIRPYGPDQVLPIRRAMLDTVQNWHDSATKGDADIQTWPPELPDLIVS